MTRSFLDRLFPRIPIHPFMMLLLQLNKVWRKHEMSCIKDLRMQHKDEMQRQRHREPYREVVMENKIAHLRRQLDTTRNDKQRLEQYRKAATAAKVRFGEQKGKDKDKDKGLGARGVEAAQRWSRRFWSRASFATKRTFAPPPLKDGKEKLRVLSPPVAVTLTLVRCSCVRVCLYVHFQRAFCLSIAEMLRLALYPWSVRGGTGAGADNKVLLEWGLATIENLSKQVAEALNENKILKRRLVAGGRPASGGAGVAGSGFGKVRVNGGPGYRGVESGGGGFSSGGERGEDGWDSETEEGGGDRSHDYDGGAGSGFIPPHQEVLTVRDFQDDDLIAEAAAATAQPGSLSMSPEAFAAASFGGAGGSGGGRKIVVKHSKTPPSRGNSFHADAGGTTSPTSGWVTISHADPRPFNTRPLN